MTPEEVQTGRPHGAVVTPSAAPPEVQFLSTTGHAVVIGGGQAAAQFVEGLRFEGHRGPITMISEEAHLPYQRPPLSKEFLARERESDWLTYRPSESYERLGIECVLGRRATRASTGALAASSWKMAGDCHMTCWPSLPAHGRAVCPTMWLGGDGSITCAP